MKKLKQKVDKRFGKQSPERLKKKSDSAIKKGAGMKSWLTRQDKIIEPIKFPIKKCGKCHRCNPEIQDSPKYC